ncbi:MAG: hypothetical protein ACTHLN_07745, partial [Tepidisphaeraceae bacterium]
VRKRFMRAFIDALESRQLFAGGALDTSFGSAGTARVTFRVVKHEQANIQQVISDSGGRTYVVALTGGYQNGYSDRTSLQIRRLTANGQLDDGWATAKSNLLAFPLTTTQQAYQSVPQVAVTVDSANRLDVMIGTTIYRFRTNGTLDTSFGKKGVLAIGGMTATASLALNAAGQIYVLGSKASTPQFGVSVVERFTADGKLDTSFLRAGAYTIPVYKPTGASNTNTYGLAVRVLADQSVVLLTGASYELASDGTTHDGTEVLKLTAAGKIDTAYGQGGVAVDFGASLPSSYEYDTINPAGIRSDGSVVMNHSTADQMTGHAHNEVISVNGKSISTVNFGPSSPAIVISQNQLGGGAVFIHQADGTELVQANDGVFKINAAGAYDTTFNNGTPISATTAALQYDGTIVTGGIGNDRFSVYVKRYFRDDGPAAVLSAKPLLTAASGYRFSVVYRDPDGIDSSTVTGAELRVVAPDGSTHKVRLLATYGLTDDNGNSTHEFVAVYKVAGPTGGAWTKADNGTYGVRVYANYVKDRTGTPIAVSRTLGYLTALIT